MQITPSGAGEAVELVPIIDGARYRDEVGGEFTTASDILDFGVSDGDFNLLGYLNEFSAPPNTTLETSCSGAPAFAGSRPRKFAIPRFKLPPSSIRAGGRAWCSTSWACCASRARS